MIKLRKEQQELREGEFIPLYEGSRVYAYIRRCGEKELLCICNMSGKSVALPRKVETSGKLVISNYEGFDNKLRPFEYRLYER